MVSPSHFIKNCIVTNIVLIKFHSLMTLLEISFFQRYVCAYLPISISNWCEEVCSCPITLCNGWDRYVFIYEGLLMIPSSDKSVKITQDVLFIINSGHVTRFSHLCYLHIWYNTFYKKEVSSILKLPQVCCKSALGSYLYTINWQLLNMFLFCGWCARCLFFGIYRGFLISYSYVFNLIPFDVVSDKPTPFDFLVDNELLRTSLEQLLLNKNLSAVCIGAFFYNMYMW